jgi:hypothetical protein
MKNNLKKYTEFINEELTAKEKLSDAELSSTKGRNDNEEKFLLLRYKFWYNIIDMTVDLRPRSFSDMCKRNTNPEEDYKEMQSLMDKKGWDIQSIKNLFSSQVDEICGYDIGDLVKGKITDKFSSILTKLNSQSIKTSILSNMEDPFRNNSLDQQNGHCDIYLYFTFKQLGLNKDFIELGGEGWATHDEPEEVMIRYRYGYHQTKYGQMMLKQAGYTPEEFREKALDNLQDYISDEWKSSLYQFLKDNKELQYDDLNNLSRFVNTMDLDNFSIIEDDRMIIYSKEISNELNKFFTNMVNEEDILSVFTKLLSIFGLDIDFTGNEIIINSKFKEF